MLDLGNVARVRQEDSNTENKGIEALLIPQR